jgi:phosphate transport system permease protein
MIDSKNITTIVKASLEKRHKKERSFKLLGRSAVTFGFFLVFMLIADITYKAIPAFHQHWVSVDISYQEDWLSIKGQNPAQFKTANFRSALKKSLYETFPDVKGRTDKRKLTQMISSSAEFTIRDHLIETPNLLGNTETVWLLLDDDIDSYLKSANVIGEAELRVNQKQATWIKELKDNGRIEKRFNIDFFTNGDSREPELAGIRGALVGTIFTMLVTLVLSFPMDRHH